MQTIRLIYKLLKDDKTYYLWNKGSYHYELTDFWDRTLLTFLDTELDTILSSLKVSGYIPTDLE